MFDRRFPTLVATSGSEWIQNRSLTLVATPPKPKRARVALGATWLACCLPLLVPLPAQPAPPPPPRAEPGGAPAAILWVGNSFFYYNNSLHNHFGRLAASAEGTPRVRSTSVTISGSGLDWHDLESLLRPDGIGRYSFVGDNEIRFNPPGPQYDTVIMMDCSQCPVHPKLQPVFHATVRRHVQTLRRHQVRPVLFMSWAYQDKPEMTAGLAEQYAQAGKANEALVIPAGLAFARALARQPDLALFAPDKRHPSLAGTYLAACTVYASLYRRSPVGLTYHAGLAPDLAAQLQAAAWETVQDYFKP